MRKTWIAALLAVSMSACGLYSKYERPEMSVTDSLYGERYASSDSTTIATMAWRDLFTDPLLQGLIQEGLDNNTDLQKARLQVEEAQTALKVARLSYAPSFNFAPSLGSESFHFSSDANNFSGWGDFANGWSYNVAVSASWEIDVFGKITNGKRRAQSVLAMSEDYRQAVHTSLVSTIATQYYTLVMLDEQLRIATETADKFEESVRVMRAMKDAGMANEVAIVQIEGACYQVKASCEDIRYSIVEVENAVAALVGSTPRHIERSGFEGAVFPADLRYGVPAQLLENRPDVRASEQQLAQAFYATRIARAGMLPSLNLGGSVGWTNTVGSAIFNPGGLLVQAAASLLQPIFNAGALKGKLTIAKAQQEEALLSYKQTLLNAGAEVNNALSKYQMELDKEEYRNRQVEALSQAVEKTELLMRHSSTTYLEVLTAQQSLLSAQTSQAQDRFDKIQSVIALYRALGGGAE